MIKTILGHLQNGVEKLESGHLSPEDMELLVEDAKELYERMVILRYKIYETNVLGVKEPVISASIRQTEIETPIDLFGSIDEPTPAPAFEVTFANGEPTDSALNEEETTPNEDLFEEEDQEVLADEVQEEESFEEESFEEESIAEDSIEEDSIEEESIEEELIEEELIEGETIVEAAPSSWSPEFSGDQPIWMAEMEANIRDNRSVFPLESLIGAFTLNEKLQFINELFDGSSDEFSSNVKQLDQLASIDAARNMIAELANTFSWDTESEIVEDFIYKICRRYATGA
jgi:hypothetical protein